MSARVVIDGAPAYRTDAWYQARFWAKVDKNGPVPELRPDLGQCWVWMGSTFHGSGYSRVRLNQKVRGAYRVAYEWVKGPVPDGLVLDHLCRNRVCVNPDHLEPVTDRENILRGEGSPAQNARKTHCDKGHEFTPENTTINTAGSRVCKACRRETMRRYYEKLKGAPLAPQNAVKTHCKRGHPLAGDNLILAVNSRDPLGSRWRQCRTCTNARKRERRSQGLVG